MSSTILLAVGAQHDVAEPIQLTCELSQGSVPHKLLHTASRPVLVVPHRKAAATPGGSAGADHAAEPVAG